MINIMIMVKRQTVIWYLVYICYLSKRQPGNDNDNDKYNDNDTDNDNDNVKEAA